MRSRISISNFRPRVFAARWLTLVVVLPGAALAGDTIYSNAPLSTGPTTEYGEAAPDGTVWSELQHDDGNYFFVNDLLGISGSYISANSGYRLADDFVIPVGESWTISSGTFFSYVTEWADSDLSPYTAYYIRIWSGRPGDAGSSVIFGNTTTNRLVKSHFAGIFRTWNTVVPFAAWGKQNRMIWANDVAIGKTLEAGHYWIEWQSAANGNTTHWQPAATVPFCRTLPTYNARVGRVSTGTWSDVIDEGYPSSAPDVAVDFPFQFHGSITGGCPADFDHDGFVTGVDFDEFVYAFQDGDTGADFDHDGFITGVDFDEFVHAFEAGCG